MLFKVINDDIDIHVGHPTDSVNIPSVFTFLTGMEYIPSVGFNSYGSDPQIYFTSNDQLPVISTCAISITFSLQTPSAYKHFKEMMKKCMLESAGFGQVK